MGSLSTNGVVIGTTITGLAVILIVVLTVVVLFVVCMKVKRSHKNEIPMISNDAYAGQRNVITHRGDAYDYPSIIMADQAMKSIDTEQNEAYATNAETKSNAAYVMNVTTERNDAYSAVRFQDMGTHTRSDTYIPIDTKQNDAYATNIETEPNEAYTK